MSNETSSPETVGSRRANAVASAVASALLAALVASVRTAAAEPPPATAGEGRLAGEPMPTLSPPAVSDPMLTLPPDAPRHIGSWDEALALIRAQSPDYVSSYQSVVRAEAQKRIAIAVVLPILTGQASYTHQFYTEAFTIAGYGGTPLTPQPLSLVSPPVNLKTVSVGATWSVLNLRGLYGIGTASENIDVTKLTFSDQRREIALSLVRTMLATLAAERVSEINRVGLRSALERLSLTQARFKFGQGTALDVDRGEQDVESARRLIIDGDEALRQTREALGAALASPGPISPPGDLDLDQFEVAVAHTCRLNDDIEHRPDVAAARGRVDLARRAVHDAELLFAPTVTLASQFADSDVAVLGPTKTWDVEGVLSVPLYDGGARYGVLRDARAAFEQARQALVSTRLNAIVESAQAMRLVGVRQASRDVAKRERDLAQRIDDRTRSGYAQGLGTSLDLVTSAQALRRADIDLAVLDYQVAEVRADAVLIDAECLY